MTIYEAAKASLMNNIQNSIIQAFQEGDIHTPTAAKRVAEIIAEGANRNSPGLVDVKLFSTYVYNACLQSHI